MDDRYQEAHYFLERMLGEDHNPEPFRWNLNAFVQALRNVTFVLQKALAERPGFENWYAQQREEMKKEPLLQAFVEGRNIVVKERSLHINSKAALGCFRGTAPKLAFVIDVPARFPSWYILEELAPRTELIDPDHSAIGEQYGVQREWFAPELGTENVVVLCDRAWVLISAVLQAAHKFVNRTCAVPEGHRHRPEKVWLLRETDVDPELPKKWGWL